MTPAERVATLRARARELGVAHLGVTAPEPTSHGEFLRAWLDAGHHGSMDYVAREDAVARRLDLAKTLPGVRSVIVVADAYPAEDPPGVPDDPGRAVIARYARGRDYHTVLKERLQRLAGHLEGECRVYVDTGPLLERDLARRAGLGWFGRNTMLIHPNRGSYFFLGVILTTEELPPDVPFEADHCGSCTACLDACPTGALLGRDESGAPVMDARRCISYLTIEHRGPIPEELRPLIGNRVFGCDICQEVCPWNERFPRKLSEEAPELAGIEWYSAVAWPGDREGAQSFPSLDGPDLVELTERIVAMSGKAYQRVFAGSPVARPGRKRMLRNLCVALGNWGATSVEGAERVRPVLERAAADRSELVREHAAWGLDHVARSERRRVGP